jgi:hypothetical protein
MRSDDYRRLHAACLAMARQSKLPDVQARWLAMAQAWLSRANDADEPKPSNMISLRSDRRDAASALPGSFVTN